MSGPIPSHTISTLRPANYANEAAAGPPKALALLASS